MGEPVARGGPIALCSRNEIDHAYRDYRRTGFGGWPWATTAPQGRWPVADARSYGHGVWTIPGTFWPPPVILCANKE